MFEKEAEEYATRECCMTCNNINHFCKEKCECWTFAKKGAEFGYIKGNQQLTKAKELIEELSSSLSVVGECEEEECELLNQAEQFLINIERYENGK